MDTRSGSIFETTEADAKRRDLLAIPSADVVRVQAMNRDERRAWAARQKGLPAPEPLTASDLARIERAQTKRDRKNVRRIIEARAREAKGRA